MKYINQLFNDTLELLKLNMVLIQPFILFFIAFGLTLTPLSSSYNLRNTLIVLVCVSLIMVVFNSGWYNMIYKCVKTPINDNLSKAEQAMHSLKLFKEFLPGVALYFYKFLGGTVIYIALLGIIITGVFSAGIEQVGIPIGVSWEEFSEAAKTHEDMKNYLEALAPGTYYQLAMWNFLLIIAIGLAYILNFLTMFWAPVIIFKETSFVRAYFESFKLIFKHPLRTFIISLSYALCLSFAFIVFFFPFILVQFIGLILIIFTVTYFNLLIFKYLEKQKIDNNSRADSIGQD
jgi:hypothetical protein